MAGKQPDAKALVASMQMLEAMRAKRPYGADEIHGALREVLADEAEDCDCDE